MHTHTIIMTTALMRIQALAAVLVVLGASSGGAGQTDPLVQAQRAFDALEYERVLPLLRQALAQEPSVEREVAIYSLMARVHVTYGRNRQARRAFAEVLKRTPNFELPGHTSPKVLAVLQQARSAFSRRVAAQPPSEPPAPSPVAPPFRPSIAAPEPEVLKPSETALRAKESSPRFYQRWWFWTAVGVAAAAGGGVAWYLVQSGPPAHDLGPIPLR